MEVKIKKEDLQKVLFLTQNVVTEKKTTMPILANVLLETKNKGLGINATDLEVGVSIDCPAEVIRPGRITVFASGLYDIIKELPNELVHISLLANNWLSINCGKAQFKIVGMAADEYPFIPVEKRGEVYVEDKTLLLDMVKKVYFAMSIDETRHNLNGIFMQSISGKNGLRMVATDGHRLSVSERESKSNWKADDGFIVPRKGVLELKKLLDTYEGDFSLRLDEKNIQVEKENVQLVIRLIEGKFPPYEQVVPKGNKKFATVKKISFMNALRRVALMASEKTKGVKLAFSPGHLEISTSSPDYGYANEDLEISYKGETFSIGFNARYFMDVSEVVEDESLVLELKDDVSPCLIRSEFDRGFMSVIMPMRL